MSNGLNAGNLTLPKERTYYAIALVFSIIVWIVCCVTIVPVIYIAAIALFIWLANGLLVAQLKADAVRIDDNQMPELALAFRNVCAKIGVSPMPELYILQSGGLLNAFATRHSGRNFVVLYSDLLEAYGPDSAEIQFLLGHELGHIKRSHLLKRIFAFPGLLLPLLGNAYSRACEASCDRFGAYATPDPQAAVNAMMVLAGGKKAALLRPDTFARQYSGLRGFFVSWYELISGYPTLTQRVENLLAIKEGREALKASRNPFAYLFALFTFGGKTSGGGNVLITVAIIGLLAAIAIPAFAKAREQAQRVACVNNLRLITAAKDKCAFAAGLNDGDVVTPEQLSKHLPRPFVTLKCPQGGTYSISRIGEDPRCSVQTHSLGYLPPQARLTDPPME